MTSIVLNTFAGMTPLVSPRLLGEGAAQLAEDCDIRSGSLASMLGLSDHGNLPKPAPIASIYRYDQNQTLESLYWFTWQDDVNVAMGLLAQNAEQFCYFTGDDYPRLTYFSAATGAGSDYPVVSYQMGTPAPSIVPTPTVLVEGTGDTETRFYVFTYVAKYLSGSRVFEGPPSAPASVDVLPIGATVRVSGLGTSAPSTGTYPTSGNYLLTHKRIYRTVPGSDEEFFYVGEVAITADYFDDAIANDVVAQQGLLESALYDPAPVGLTGLIAINNAMLAGFDGMDWYCSELNQPHAWPTDYRKSLDAEIVMHQPIGGNAVVVCTKTVPHIISGTRPEAMTREPLAFPQACVAKRSMVTVPGGAVYASPDGLCLVGPGVQRVLTEGILSRAQWQAYKPESMHGYWFENQYIAFFDTGSRTGGLVYEPRSNTLIETDIYATAGYVDPLRDALFLAVTEAGIARLKKWSGGASRTFTWKSRQYQLRRPMNLCYARVMASAYPVTLKVTADGVERTYTVSGPAEFRLHGGFLAQVWEVQAQGTGTVYQVVLSDSSEEIASL